MNRDEKATVIDDIAAQIEGADAIFAIDYRGISVPQAAALRSDLREADASFRIVKNRLTKLAADKAGRDDLKDLLEGPTALTFVRGDTAMAAKAITTFNREHDVLTFKGGFMEGLTLDPDKFTSIARLPSRDVLNGQFAGVVASPLTGLVRGLSAMVSGLAIALQQIAEQGLVSGEAPAEPEAVDNPDPPGGEAEDVSGSSPVAEEAPEPSAETEAAEPEAVENPDTPGREAEEVSGSDSEPQPDAEEAEPQPDENPDPPGGEAEDVSGSDVTSEQTETSNDENEQE